MRYRPDGVSGPRTVVLADIDDAHVSRSSPDTRFGGAAALEVDTESAFKQAFLKPSDLGDIAPGSQIRRAELVLQIFDAGDPVEVREALAGWDEGAVRWSGAPAVGPALATFPGHAGRISVDLTALVQRWADGAPLYGIGLYPTGSDGVDLYSADHGEVAKRPYLAVEVLD